MTDAALTSDQIATRLSALYAMRDSGVLIVRHGDTSTQFRSLDDLLRAIAILEAQQTPVGAKPTRSRVSYIRQSTKGYGRDDFPGNGNWGDGNDCN